MEPGYRIRVGVYTDRVIEWSYVRLVWTSTTAYKIGLYRESDDNMNLVIEWGCVYLIAL